MTAFIFTINYVFHTIENSSLEKLWDILQGVRSLGV